MRISLFQGSVIAILANLAACSPSAAPTAKPTTPGQSVVVPLQAQPDLSPVSEPGNVILVARIKNTKATLSAAERMARLPLSLDKLLQDQLREKGLDVFALDAGADLAVALDPASPDGEQKFLGAASIPVRDLEQARAAFATAGDDFQPLVPGVYRAQFVKKDSEDAKASPPDDDDDKSAEDGVRNEIEEATPDLTYCDLAASLGTAPARLVCSSTIDELNALRPWMTRGLSTQDLGPDDFYADLRVGPFRDRYLPMLRSQMPAAELLAKSYMERELDIHEPKLLDVPGQLMDEGVNIVNDVDHFTFTGRLDPDAMTMSFAGSASFRGTSAWLTRLYTTANAKAGPPPEIFWRTPKDAMSATYSRGADPKQFEGMREVVRLALDTLLDRAKGSAASRSALNEFLAAAPVHDAPVVSASGTIGGLRIPNPREKKGTPKPADAVRDFQELTNKSLGWTLVGIDAPSSEYANWLRKSATLYDRLYREAANHSDIGKEVRKAKWIPKVRIRTNVQGYPRGTIALEATSSFDSKDIWAFSNAAKSTEHAEHPKGPAARGSITLQLVVMPDGPNRTWIGMSAQRDVLRDRMHAVLSSAPRDGTIESLAGLESLRTTPTTAGGFISYGKIMTDTLESLRKSMPELENVGIDKVLAALPNGLHTPVLLLQTGTTGATPSAKMEFRVQRGTIEDIAAFVQFALSPAGKRILNDLDKLDSTHGDEEESD